MTHWIARYRAAYNEYFARSFPVAFKDHGIPNVKIPVVSKSNGLRMMCCNYCKWNGHHLEPTNNMGRPIQKYAPKFNIFSGNIENIESHVEWQKGSGIKGTSDCKGHINNPRHTFPIPVYIEIKIAKDKQSAHQVAYEHRVTETGAIYHIVKTPEDFFSFYDYVLSL